MFYHIESCVNKVYLLFLPGVGEVKTVALSLSPPIVNTYSSWVGAVYHAANMAPVRANLYFISPGGVEVEIGQFSQL